MCEELEKLKTREATAASAFDRAQRKLDAFKSTAPVALDETRHWAMLHSLRDAADHARLMKDHAKAAVEKHRQQHGCSE